MMTIPRSKLTLSSIKTLTMQIYCERLILNFKRPFPAPVFSASAAPYSCPPHTPV